MSTPHERFAAYLESGRRAYPGGVANMVNDAAAIVPDLARQVEELTAELRDLKQRLTQLETEGKA